MGGVCRVMQPIVDKLGLHNQAVDYGSVTSNLLGDTNRLSELEKYNVAQSGRLLSVDRICETAQIAFDARFCCVALVDHEKLHMLGYSGPIVVPQQKLLELAVAVICQPTDCAYLLHDEASGCIASGTERDDENSTRMLVLPLQSENGSRLGVFVAGIDGHREITKKDRELADCFVANSMQTLELQRMQSSFARRAEISRRQAEKLKTQKWALVRNDKLFGKVSRMARICGWELDAQLGQVVWSGKAQAVFDLPADADVKLRWLLRRLGRENLMLFRKLVEECQVDGIAFEHEIAATTFTGNKKWFRITGEAESDGNGVNKVIGTVQDVSNQKEREAIIKHVATHDELTGLANRKLFKSEFARLLTNARRSGEAVSLLLIDADHFKLVNDTYGHNDGDQVLKTFAKHIRECVRAHDLVARLGGDEFGVILADTSGQDELADICKRLQLALSTGIDHDGGRSLVTASIGTATYPQDSVDPEDLLHKADLALYRSKEKGRACFTCYEQSMNELLDEKFNVIGNVSNAIDAGEIVPYFQPIVDGNSGCVSALEALVRWETSDGRILPPGAYIEALEDPTMSGRIGETMINQVIDQIVRWSGDRILAGPVAINLSGAELQKISFAEIFISKLSSAGLHPSNVAIEVTEGVFLARGNSVIKDNLELLAAAGVRIALDDFGTGFASLTHLKEFPVDQVKIDKSFIGQLPGDAECLGIVKSIIALGRNLGLYIVAEGVETKEQANILGNLGCDFLQGYLYSKAVRAEEIPALIHRFEAGWLEDLKVVHY